jgi:hypothetical protein
MHKFKLAHIHHQGVDLIIIPLDSSFGHKTKPEQHKVIASLQLSATSAGLRGTVVPVWDAGVGRMAFIAPQNWHPFFSSINMGFVAANINRELTCG